MIPTTPSRGIQAKPPRLTTEILLLLLILLGRRINRDPRKIKKQVARDEIARVSNARPPLRDRLQAADDGNRTPFLDV